MIDDFNPIRACQTVFVSNTIDQHLFNLAKIGR
jgi:hypothetical protein